MSSSALILYTFSLIDTSWCKHRHLELMMANVELGMWTNFENYVHGRRDS